MMDESYDKNGPVDPPAYADTGADYTTPTTTTTTTHTETAALSLNKGYVTTIPGILKLVQAVCSLACLISASIYGGGASGWGAFVAGWALFCSLVWFCLYLFEVISKIPPIRVLIEWIYYLVLSIMFLIASVVAAATAAVYAPHFPGLAAYAFFGFLATAALITDLVLQFKVWKNGGHAVTTHATTTTTTTEEGSTVTTEVHH